jgi:hypothetical protein
MRFLSSRINMEEEGEREGAHAGQDFTFFAQKRKERKGSRALRCFRRKHNLGREQDAITITRRM